MIQLDLFRKENGTPSVESKTKLCVGCKEVKTLDAFRVLVRRVGDRHTLSSTCSTCDDRAEILKREWRRRNPLPENYRCPICDTSHQDYLDRGIYNTQSPFSVDHCQTSMKVRGWICNPCNSAIGLAKHDITVLKKMVDYLNEQS